MLTAAAGSDIDRPDDSQGRRASAPVVSGALDSGERRRPMTPAEAPPPPSSAATDTALAGTTFALPLIGAAAKTCSTLFTDGVNGVCFCFCFCC